MSRIIVVDDEEIARSTLADILRLEGYEVTTVASGEVALRMLNTKPFDVMILDLKMPGLSGIDVIRRLASMTVDVQVILLTAYGSMESAIDALRFHAHDYLIKPASPRAILASVKNAIERREAMIGGQSSGKGSVYIVEGKSRVNFEARTIVCGTASTSLTPTEARLLKVFFERPGEVLSHRDLVRLVEGYEVGEREAAGITRPIVSRLRRKLSLFPESAHWIKSIHGTGYLFDRRVKPAKD